MNVFRTAKGGREKLRDWFEWVKLNLMF
jgi:hypothetical protein